MATANFGLFPGQFAETEDYYQKLLTSQWSSVTAPNLNSWLAANLQLYQDMVTCCAQLLVAYNLATSAVITTNGSTVAATGIATATSQSVQVVNAVGIMIGMTVTGTGIAANTIVIGLKGNLVILSLPTTAAFTANALTFTLTPAVGAQLDVIGAIVGQSRTVSFQPSGTTAITGATLDAAGTHYEVGDIFTVLQGGASGGQLQVISIGAGGAVTEFGFAYGQSGTGFGYSVATGLATTGGHGTGLTINITSVGGPSPILDDTTYRFLLQCRIGQNHWNGQIAGIQAYLAPLLPGGSITITDNQNMTATIHISGSLTEIVQDLITSGLVVARPMGVEYSFSFASAPYFGFDESNSQISGLDQGHFL